MIDVPTNNSPTDFAIVACSVAVNRPIDEAWREIGDFADAGRFLNVFSKLVSGIGQLGSVRLVGDAILEVMVGSSSHSYSYAQVRGPMAGFSYHGCLELSPLNSESCRLSYTLVYDQAPMDAARRTSEFERVSLRFKNAAQAMKAAAETSRD
ncbi:MAG TPA: hypothetical protein VGD59_01485 [Acidisarcina sp.]